MGATCWIPKRPEVAPMPKVNDSSINYLGQVNRKKRKFEVSSSARKEMTKSQ